MSTTMSTSLQVVGKREGVTMRASRTAAFLFIVAAFFTLASSSSAAITIYPIDRAEILAGAKFDVKMEFDGTIAAADAKLTVNGSDHVRVFAGPARPRAQQHGITRSELLP